VRVRGRVRLRLRLGLRVRVRRLVGMPLVRVTVAMVGGEDEERAPACCRSRLLGVPQQRLQRTHTHGKQAKP